MELSTDSINHGFFDPRYTCDFDNSSPEIHWSDVPAHAKGFVLIAEDHDSPKGLFTHWMVYNIPAHVHHLPAGIPAQETLPNGIRQGINSFGKLGYGGPSPAVGERPHRYFFRLYALRDLPELPSRASRELLMAAIEPLVIATAQFMGRYERAIQKAG